MFKILFFTGIIITVVFEITPQDLQDMARTVADQINPIVEEIRNLFPND